MGKKKQFWIGIDLGGTKMLTALLDSKFKVRAEEKVKVDVSKGQKYLLASMKDSISRVLDDSGVKLKQLGGIGIGCPGIIDTKSGRVLSSPNIPFLKNFKFSEKIGKMIKVPIVLENDVNTGLYGEFQFGAAKGHKHVIGVFVGTGIGGALILNGKLYHGLGAAGEVGHMLVDSRGPLCGCGQRGCLEVFAGRVAMAAEAAVLAIKQQAPHLYDLAGADISKIKSKVLAKAIQEGDKSIKEMIESKSRVLGFAVANLVNLLNPEMIVLGGGVVEAMPKLIVNEARRAMESRAMKPMGKQVKVVEAKLGDHAIVRGAAKLIADFVNED